MAKLIGNEPNQVPTNGDLGKLAFQEPEAVNITGGTLDSVTVTNLTTDGASLDGAVVINESGADVDFRIESDTDANAFFLDGTNGRVGIGTSNPDEKLDVRGTIQVGIDGTTAGEIRFMDSGSVTEEATISSDANGGLIFGGNSGPGELIFKTGSSTERMRIDSSGNVGIGTSSPSAKLEIKQVDGTPDTGFQVTRYNNDNQYLSLWATGGLRYIDAVGDSSVSSVLSFRRSIDSGSTFSESMRIDSSGNVGIGTSSPLRSLHVSGAGDTGIMLQTTNANTDAEIWEIQSAADGSNNANLVFRSRTNAGTGGSEAMRIDSSGNVGIGTSSPSYKIDVNTPTVPATDTYSGLQLQSGNYGYIIEGGIKQGAGAELVFSRNQNGTITERIKIDSGGNLLVGKTSADTTTAGFEVRPDGHTIIGRDGNLALNLNRLTSDGEILRFRKDGTTVGSIGTIGGDPYMSDGTIGFRLYNNNSIIPTNNTGGGNNNAVDLGGNGLAFRNLYLSGGVYLGGTGSANYLDDYETGAWTPTISSGTATFSNNVYVKVGDLVFAVCKIQNISDQSTGTQVTIGGLPFTSYASANCAGGGVMMRYVSQASSTPYVNSNNTTFHFYGTTSGNWDGLIHSDFNNVSAEIYCTVIYRAA